MRARGGGQRAGQGRRWSLCDSPVVPVGVRKLGAGSAVPRKGRCLLSAYACPLSGHSCPCFEGQSPGTLPSAALALGQAQPNPGLTCTSARGFSGCGSHMGWGLGLLAVLQPPPPATSRCVGGWSLMGVQLCQELLDALLSALSLAQAG